MAELPWQQIWHPRLGHAASSGRRAVRDQKLCVQTRCQDFTGEGAPLFHEASGRLNVRPATVLVGDACLR